MEQSLEVLLAGEYGRGNEGEVPRRQTRTRTLVAVDDLTDLSRQRQDDQHGADCQYQGQIRQVSMPGRAQLVRTLVVGRGDQAIRESVRSLGACNCERKRHEPGDQPPGHADMIADLLEPALVNRLPVAAERQPGRGWSA